MWILHYATGSINQSFLALDMFYLHDHAGFLHVLDHEEEDPHCHQPNNIYKLISIFISAVQEPF